MIQPFRTLAAGLADSTFSVPASFVAALAIAYVGFVLFRLLRFVKSFAATLNLLREARPLLLAPEAAWVWADCRRLVALSGVRLLQSQHVPGPVTIGTRYPAILLPPNFIGSVTPQELRAALAHECVHVQRHDFAKNLCYEAAGCLITFHPATWLLQARIAETREMVCDAAAARSLPARFDYIQSLLRLATLIATRPPATPPHAIGIFDANILEKRIMTLKTPTQHASTPRRAGAIVLASACLCCAFAVTVVAAPLLTPSVSASSAAQQTADHVYSIGGDVMAPKLIYQKIPEFPSSAHDLPQSFAGSCLLGLTVDRSGIPKNVHVLRSLKDFDVSVGLPVDRSGIPQKVHVLRSLSKDFDVSAIQAVQQYRFKPAQLSGKSVSAAIKIEVFFQKF